MVIDGWLISWWLVPDYRELGESFFSGNTFYTNNTFFVFWALSVPLGSIITALGLALYSKLDKLRIIIFIAGSILFLIWLAIWSQSYLYPIMYGVAGGIILFSFIISIWSLAKVRMNAEGIYKNILDIRAIAYIFLVITAWGMCGLLGIPAFGLTPENIIEQNTKGLLLTMSAKVLVTFTLAWICLFVSQYLEYKNKVVIVKK
jgi:hypothetical protein